jgi:nicotinic acid mononucleotide adenylyltransferase
LYTEARRRLFPSRFAPPDEALERVATYFFPLAAETIRAQSQTRQERIAHRLPFTPLSEEELHGWPAGEEYRHLCAHLERDGFLVCLAMAQEWMGLSIQDHVLGVTGLSLWIARQLARAVPVDLPLLHGAAIGHDVGKFGCIGDEEKRTPRLHYYYTHDYYAARALPGLGHVATDHSCWDLELIRLPIETQLLIYADFRVKDVVNAEGQRSMSIIPLKDSFATILGKLENVDKVKYERYQAVYRKLRDLEDYLVALRVELDPPAFPAGRRTRPDLPKGLRIVDVMAGQDRADVVALATGRQIPTTSRFFATAHNVGVMERLRDLPALRALLEEARSFEGWRDLRTYLGVVGDYSPAFSMEQRELALDFFFELLSHRDDDIRYHAGDRIGELLALGEESWRKDLPEGVVVEDGNWVLRQLERVLGLLDRAVREPDEDMSPAEQVCYAVPVILRRFLQHADTELHAAALPLIVERLSGRVGDRRPLVGLYVCEAFEVMLPHIDAAQRLHLVEVAQAWSHHDSTNTRLMSWRLLRALAREAESSSELRPLLRYAIELLSRWARRDSSVAELHLLEDLADKVGLATLAERCREFREKSRLPVREVMLRNLKGQIGWVEKKVNCDYLLESALQRMREGGDPDAHFANEVAFHLANVLKVSRVEGTRFHAGNCLMQLLPMLTDTQRNDLTVELLRSLQLDAEAITRYIPRFLGPLMASLPEQEFLEALGDLEEHVRRSGEPLQRLLLQTAGWVLLSLHVDRLAGGTLARLVGVLLGALAETRDSTVHEAFAQLAMVLERLLRKPGNTRRLRMVLELATKKLLTMVTHRAGDRGRFFLVAQALNRLDQALGRARPRPRFPEHPSVGFIPGTFDPFTRAHTEVVARTLALVDEVLVQVDDYSWRKHAQPRKVRQELAWMALAGVPGAYTSPFAPPVNIADQASLRELRRKLTGRELHLVVGSDVLEGASAYRDRSSEIWSIRHLVTSRADHRSRAWEEKLGWFTTGVQVFRVSDKVKTVSSSSLRAALDRGDDLDAFCEPLVARILRERKLYVHHPPQKEIVFQSRSYLRAAPPGSRQLPGELEELMRVDSILPVARWTGNRAETCVLVERESERALAALSWQEVAAASLPVVLREETLARHTEARLVGLGALVDAVALCADGGGIAELELLLGQVMGRWLDAGLLFVLVGVPRENDHGLWQALRTFGAGWLVDEPEQGPTATRWAAIQLTDPLVVVWDLEQVLQPIVSKAESVRRVMEQGRARLAEFFAHRTPGSLVFHVPEMEWKREVVEWAKQRIAEDGPGRKWVMLGLGRQFSRDIVGDSPTIAIDLERFLTWEGYEDSVRPSFGSPALDLQLNTARELGRDALLLVPFLDGAEAVLQVAAAARAAGIKLREVLIGVANASAHATLHLEAVPHRCGVVIPRWRGVLRESALTPFVGGWSIAGREPLPGSLVPSLNDCLPYHDPHPLGLERELALDFSRVVLDQACELFEAIEDVFRHEEGRILSLTDLGMVVRIPRCPPYSRGFQPPRGRYPSELLAEDVQALARLHPESHAAHRAEWRRR